MNIPKFTAENAIPNPSQRYSGEMLPSSPANVVLPAGGFRVTCPGNPALGALCTILGAPSGFIPCFGNSGCMWFHAGLVFWPCFTCSHN